MAKAYTSDDNKFGRYVQYKLTNNTTRTEMKTNLHEQNSPNWMKELEKFIVWKESFKNECEKCETSLRLAVLCLIQFYAVSFVLFFGSKSRNRS